MNQNSDPTRDAKQLEAILDNAVDAIITINQRGLIQSVNRATEQMFGYAADEIVGKNVKILMPSPFHEEHDGYLENYLTSGVKKIIGSGREVVGKRKDGSTFPMHLAVSEVQVDGGERLFTGSVRDMSDIEEREARLQAILDNAVDAIITIDDRGVVQSANPAAESVFGYAVGEIVGRNVNRLMPSPYHEEHDGYLENYLSSGIKKIIGIGREVVGKRKDGSTFPMHLAVSEIKVGDRRWFTGIVRDISDLKEAESRLENLNEELEQRVEQRTAELRDAQAELVKKEKLAMLGQVSGGIAHEIRNPLNAVKTSVFYLLNAKSPTPEKTKEHLDRIDRQVTLVDNVVTALSDVAKMPEPQLRPCSVLTCLRGVVSTVSVPANIDVTIDAADDLPMVLIDEQQVPIVFRNLIRNARDAMPDGGEIRVAAYEQNDKICIDVIDTGIGISPEDLERITEPLYSTKARGMGLGLAISLAILEKNNGTLDVSSEVDKGSTFHVELEVAKEG